MIAHYWDVEPDIPRVATGIKDRVGRLKALGNAVVPQQFYPVFKAIEEVERGSLHRWSTCGRTDRWRLDRITGNQAIGLHDAENDISN